jgi:glutamine synthetase
MTDQSQLGDANWIRFDFLDLFGGARALHVPADHYADVVRLGVPFDGSALEGEARSLEADMLLVPDPSTLTRVSDTLARVVCTAHTLDGTPWWCDPRVALEAVISRLADTAQVAEASAELEFYLLNPDRSPVDSGGYYDEEEGIGIGVTRAAATRLAQASVAIESCHHEAGPGQFEIDLASLPPLGLADAIVHAQQVVRDEAVAVGLVATFMARPFEGQPGSGLHIHQHLGAALFDTSGRLTDDGRAFVAGQLLHARALSALAAPTVNSYKRLHSGPEAPSAAIWAYQNRAALVRVSALLERSPSIEYRGADPSANPYLLVAALLVAGTDGIEQRLELPLPSEENELGGYEPGFDKIRFDPLPRDLDDALDALVGDDVLVDAFDGRLLTRLVDGRRAEASDYRSRVTDWELDRALGTDPRLRRAHS